MAIGRFDTFLKINDLKILSSRFSHPYHPTANRICLHRRYTVFLLSFINHYQVLFGRFPPLWTKRADNYGWATILKEEYLIVSSRQVRNKTHIVGQ